MKRKSLTRINVTPRSVNGANSTVARRAKLADAARLLGVSVTTLQRDIRRGAPTVELGGCGRGRGTVVDVRMLQQWRTSRLTSRLGDPLALCEECLLDIFHSGVHHRINITDGQLAYVLITIYESLFERSRNLPLVELPEQMQHLCRICLDSLEKGSV